MTLHKNIKSTHADSTYGRGISFVAGKMLVFAIKKKSILKKYLFNIYKQSLKAEIYLIPYSTVLFLL